MYVLSEWKISALILNFFIKRKPKKALSCSPVSLTVCFKQVMIITPTMMYWLLPTSLSSLMFIVAKRTKLHSVYASTIYASCISVMICVFSVIFYFVFLYLYYFSLSSSNSHICIIIVITKPKLSLIQIARELCPFHFECHQTMFLRKTASKFCHLCEAGRQPTLG